MREIEDRVETEHGPLKIDDEQYMRSSLLEEEKGSPDTVEQNAIVEELGDKLRDGHAPQTNFSGGDEVLIQL